MRGGCSTRCRRWSGDSTRSCRSRALRLRCSHRPPAARSIRAAATASSRARPSARRSSRPRRKRTRRLPPALDDKVREGAKRSVGPPRRRRVSADGNLVELEHLTKHFAVKQGVFARGKAQVHAVEDVSLTVRTRRDARDRRRVRLRQVDDRAADAAAARPDRRDRSASKATDISRLSQRQLRPLRREMQMIFQDPYSSLNPRKTVGQIVGAPFAIHGAEGREDARAGAARDGRAEPGALQPLPPRVLGRPAAAHRRRACARALAEADRLRRAGVGARRLDPGADPQPAAQPAARLQPDLRLHLARPLRAPADRRPDRGHVPRPASSRSATASRSTSIRSIHTRPRCSRPFPARRPAAASGSC